MLTSLSDPRIQRPRLGIRGRDRNILLSPLLRRRFRSVGTNLMRRVGEEVVAPERLVFVELVERKSADNDAPEFLFELLNTITFTEHAGKTRVEVRSQVLRTTMLGAPYAEGMETGWVESLERLAAVVTQK